MHPNGITTIHSKQNTLHITGMSMLNGDNHEKLKIVKNVIIVCSRTQS